MSYGSPSVRMNRGVPHLPQKPRSTAGDDLKRAASPRVKVNDGARTKGRPKLPPAFWHMRQ
jgi:hypothetical protein